MAEIDNNYLELTELRYLDIRRNKCTAKLVEAPDTNFFGGNDPDWTGNVNGQPYTLNNIGVLIFDGRESRVSFHCKHAEQRTGQVEYWFEFIYPPGNTQSKGIFQLIDWEGNHWVVNNGFSNNGAELKFLLSKA